jgi:hypothetical protein
MAITEKAAPRTAAMFITMAAIGGVQPANVQPAAALDRSRDALAELLLDSVSPWNTRL